MQLTLRSMAFLHTLRAIVVLRIFFREFIWNCYAALGYTTIILAMHNEDR